jgi:phosphonate transport system substrate-binding protein
VHRVLVLLPLLLLIALACGGNDENGSTDGGDAGEPSGTKVLRFTAIPDQNTSELQRKFGPVAAYLAEKLGVEVEYVPSTDYPASVEMFKNGDVHVAWFGGLTGVQARHAVKGARAIIQGAEDPTFRSYFIAHRDSGLTWSEEFPEGLAELSFTFGSRSSTSGRLMPEFHILEHSGKTAVEFFEDPPGFSGNHDATAELVESGRYEVGAINYQVYDRRVKAFRGEIEDPRKTDPEVCVKIWETPPYADYNLTAHPDLETLFGAGFTDRLQRAFLEMKDPDLLAAFGRSGMIVATNEDFEGIRRVARKLDMIR